MELEDAVAIILDANEEDIAELDPLLQDTARHIRELGEEVDE